jgi:hypothetical protein
MADHFYPTPKDGEEPRLLSGLRDRVWTTPARLLLPRRRSPSNPDS